MDFSRRCQEQSPLKETYPPPQPTVHNTFPANPLQNQTEKAQMESALSCSVRAPQVDRRCPFSSTLRNLERRTGGTPKRAPSSCSASVFTPFILENARRSCGARLLPAAVTNAFMSATR